MHAFLRGNPTVNAIVGSLTMLAILLASFSLFEPMVTHGQNPNPETITVNQEITSQIAFLTAAQDVVMSNSIQGLTGGTSYGTTTFNVTSNDPDGYTVTIAFSDAVAMQATGSASEIANYNPTAGGALADYNFAVAAGATGFGYTVQNVTTPTDIDATFKDDGVSTCDGADTGTLVGHCWFNKDDATVAEQIINAAGATVGTGATSSVTFRVGVGANPVPALQTGWYVATATLTAAVK